MHKTFVSIASCILSRNSSVSRMAFCLQACVREEMKTWVVNKCSLLRRTFSLFNSENSNELFRSVNIGYRILRRGCTTSYMSTFIWWQHEIWLHIWRVYRWIIWFIYSMHYRRRYLLPFLYPTSETHLTRALERWRLRLRFYFTVYWPVPMRVFRPWGLTFISYTGQISKGCTVSTGFWSMTVFKDEMWFSSFKKQWL